MIHKIKALHDNGQGLSMRQIARELQISRNSVKKYLAMEVEEISSAMDASLDRTKKLDEYRSYIIN